MGIRFSLSAIKKHFPIDILKRRKESKSIIDNQKMYFILNNLYSNLGILSSIKIYIPCEFNINNLYFDMDISLFKDKILYILGNVLLLLLLLTIISFSNLYIQDKRLVNFNESPVGLYDSGDNIDCSSSSAGGNYTSSDSDDGEDDDTKLSRRRRR
jgi:hypothetical protein